MTSPALCVLPAQTHQAAAAMNKSLQTVFLPMHTHTRARQTRMSNGAWVKAVCSFGRDEVAALPTRDWAYLTVPPLSSTVSIFSFSNCLTYHCVLQSDIFQFKTSGQLCYVYCEFAIWFVCLSIRWLCCRHPLCYRTSFYLLFWTSQLSLLHHNIMSIETNGFSHTHTCDEVCREMDYQPQQSKLLLWHFL